MLLDKNLSSLKPWFAAGLAIPNLSNAHVHSEDKTMALTLLGSTGIPILGYNACHILKNNWSIKDVWVTQSIK